MTGEFLHAFAQIQQPEMAGTNVASLRAEKLCAAALDHIRACVVDEWTGYFAGAAHADVVTGTGSLTATSVRGQQIIPAIVIDHVRCFAIDGEIDGLITRVQTFARAGIKLD